MALLRRAAPTLAELERRHILAAFERLGDNRKATALPLGIGENTLWRLLKSYGFVRERGSGSEDDEGGTYALRSASCVTHFGTLAGRCRYGRASRSCMSPGIQAPAGFRHTGVFAGARDSREPSPG
jgi:hypothetical protein